MVSLRGIALGFACLTTTCRAPTNAEPTRAPVVLIEATAPSARASPPDPGGTDAAAPAPSPEDPWATASWAHRPLAWHPVAPAPSSFRAPRWTAHASGTTEVLGVVFGTSADDVWIGGEQGTVLRTRDRGKTFRSFTLEGDEPVLSIWGAGPEDVWVLGQHAVHRVLHGDTLATLSVKLEGEGYGGAGHVRGTSAADVWLATGALVHTVDGGATWSSTHGCSRVLGCMPGRDGAADLWTSSPLDVWAAGFWFFVTHSVDGGKTWEHATYTPGMEEDFHLRGSGPGDVWIVGFHLGPTHSLDGGATWQEERPPNPSGPSWTPPFYNDFWSSGGGWAWAATNFGVWVRPGKTPWVRMLDTGDIAALWASGPGDLWAVGKAGRVLHAP
jgi:hypothetical protein